MKTAPLCLLLFLVATLAHAGPPTGKLVMLDVDKLSTVTVTESNSRQLTWRELVDAGINGVQFRSWTHLGDPSLTHAGWVEQAHEYGMWVCGGSGHDVDYMVPDVAYLAGMDVDFIQLDEPMGHGLTEAGYHQVKNSARSVKQDTPVYITDVAFNDVISGWSNVDGLMQELYVDNWFNPCSGSGVWCDTIGQATNYRDSHPGTEVFMWVWLLNNHPEPPYDAYPDSKFNTWFNASFDQLGKVLLFIFTKREGAAAGSGDWGTRWAQRLPTIQAKTAPYRKPLPRWRNFAPVGVTGTGVPDVSVEVRSAEVGLDPASVEAYYSVNGGITWARWHDVSCTGDRGTTGWQTITANNVPFANVSSTLNQVRFKITDTYSGNYYRSARTDTAQFTVNVDRLQWTDFVPGEIVNDATPDCSVRIEDPEGLEAGSATAEYTNDGGDNWSPWPVESVDIDAIAQTLTARDVPFMTESPSANRIRFNVRDGNGEELQSRAFPVRVAIPPTWSGFSPRYTSSFEPDCQVLAEDENGVRVGRSEQAAGPDTALLLHLDGGVVDASGNDVPVTRSGGAWTSIDTWKTGGGAEPMLGFDGVDDYVVTEPLVVDTGELTMMAWVRASDRDEAIAYGGVEEQGSFLFRFLSDAVTVAGRAGGTNLSLGTDPGSFSWGEWYHVAGTVAGDQIALYVNGVLEASTTWTNFELAPAKAVSLGRAMNRTRYFAGHIDEVLVERRALSAEEVLFAHSSGLYRHSTDGGSSWDIDWTPCEVTPSGANAAVMMVAGVPFGQYSETDNVISFMIRDGNGNVGVEQFVVKITETGIDPCGDRECGEGCGDCSLGNRCDDSGRCVPEGGADPLATTDGVEPVPTMDTTLVGGCSAGPVPAWVVIPALIVRPRRSRGRRQ